MIDYTFADGDGVEFVLVIGNVTVENTGAVIAGTVASSDGLCNKGGAIRLCSIWICVGTGRHGFVDGISIVAATGGNRFRTIIHRVGQGDFFRAVRVRPDDGAQRESEIVVGRAVVLPGDRLPIACGAFDYCCDIDTMNFNATIVSIIGVARQVIGEHQVFDFLVRSNVDGNGVGDRKIGPGGRLILGSV